MTELNPDDLDINTKLRLFEDVADLILDEIDVTDEYVDPGDTACFVNSWWADVLVDGYNALVRIDSDREGIEELHIHGVPLYPDEDASVPTLRHTSPEEKP